MALEQLLAGLMSHFIVTKGVSYNSDQEECLSSRIGCASREGQGSTTECYVVLGDTLFT